MHQAFRVILLDFNYTHPTMVKGYVVTSMKNAKPWIVFNNIGAPNGYYMQWHMHLHAYSHPLSKYNYHYSLDAWLQNWCHNPTDPQGGFQQVYCVDHCTPIAHYNGFWQDLGTWGWQTEGNGWTVHLAQEPQELAVWNGLSAAGQPETTAEVAANCMGSTPEEAEWRKKAT